MNSMLSLALNKINNWFPRLTVLNRSLEQRSLFLLGLTLTLSLQPCIWDSDLSAEVRIHALFTIALLISRIKLNNFIRSLQWIFIVMGTILIFQQIFMNPGSSAVDKLRVSLLFALSTLSFLSLNYRNAIRLIFLSAGLMALESLRPTHLTLILGFLAYIISSMATLLEIHSTKIDSHFFGILLRTILKTIIPAALALSLATQILPGFEMGLLNSDNQNVTGFNPNTNLSSASIHDLALSREVAFRALFPDGQKISVDKLYWRGAVLWRSEGMTWKQAHTNKNIVEGPSSIVTPTYEVILKSGSNTGLFALEGTEQIYYRPPLEGAATKLRGGVFSHQISMDKFFIYTNRSVHPVSLIPPKESHATDLDPAIWSFLTQAPAEKDPRIIELVKGLRALAIVEPLSAVNTLGEWLQSQQLEYTLKKPELPATTVADFVFRLRAGYCEQYAAAFATLLRLSDIPTRVVLGYRGGEKNAYDQRIIVRGQDAHAWVEYWDKKLGGFRSVDPTAFISNYRPLQESQTKWMPLSLLQLGDSLATKAAYWQLNAQILGQWGRTKFSTHKGPIKFALLGAITLIAALFAAYSLVIWMRSKAFSLKRSRKTNHSIVRIYDDYCHFLANQGLIKEVHEGPQSFLKRTEKRWPDAVALCTDFTQTYIAMRYGHQEGDSKLLSSKLRTLKRLFKD